CCGEHLEQTLAALDCNAIPIKQGIRERRITENRSVVVPPIAWSAALAYALGDRRSAAGVVAHQIESNSELNERKSGLRLAARIVQLPESGQGRFSLSRQHVTAVCKYVEASVVPVSENFIGTRRSGRLCRQLRYAFLKTPQQEIHRQTVRSVRNGETLLAGIHQKVGDVGGKPVLIFRRVTPQAETAVWRLHGPKLRDCPVQHFDALFAGERFEAKTARLVFVDEYVRISSTGKLFAAAIRIREQILDRRADVDRWLVGHSHVGQRRVGI